MGITIDVIPTYPLTDSDEDIAAARLEDGQRNRWFLDPVLGGGYPRRRAPALRAVPPGGRSSATCATIAAPIDFLGVNYYPRHIVRAQRTAHPVVGRDRGAEYTEMGWEVYPDGLFELLVRCIPSTSPRRSTSPRTARRSRTCARTAASRTRGGCRTSSASRCDRARDRGRRAGARATSCGRCSTTSSGHSATRSASGSSSSTSRRSSACRRPATLVPGLHRRHARGARRSARARRRRGRDSARRDDPHEQERAEERPERAHDEDAVVARAPRRSRRGSARRSGSRAP